MQEKGKMRQLAWVIRIGALPPTVLCSSVHGRHETEQLHDWVVLYSTPLHHRQVFEYCWEFVCTMKMQCAGRERLHPGWLLNVKFPNYTNSLKDCFFSPFSCFYFSCVWFRRWQRDFSWCGFPVLSSPQWIKTPLCSFQSLSAHWSVWLSFNSSQKTLK